MKMLKIAATTAALLGAVAAHAQSVNLDVTGTVVNPPCSLTITNGNIAHGTVAVNTMGTLGGVWRTFPTVARTLNVSCTTNQVVSLAVADGYAAGIGTGTSGALDTNQFSLINTAQSNAAIGHVSLGIGSGITVGGVAAAKTLRAPGVSSAPVWVDNPNTSWIQKDGSYSPVSSSSATAPTAVSGFVIPVNVTTNVGASAITTQLAAGNVDVAARMVFTVRTH